MDTMCPICLGVGLVIKARPDRPWNEELGCMCGIARPCECNAVGQEPDFNMLDEKVTRH
jgi:hypothetical protein